MARIILNCSYNPPLKEFDSELHPCFVARGITWIRSFFAVDGSRSICEFEAPYAEIVRDACRQAGIPYEQVWKAEVWQGQESISFASSPTLIVSEIDCGQPLATEQWTALKDPACLYFQEPGFARLCSLISLDGRQAFCIFVAGNTEIVSQAHRQANIPFTRIWRSQLILP